MILSSAELSQVLEVVLDRKSKVKLLAQPFHLLQVVLKLRAEVFVELEDLRLRARLAKLCGIDLALVLQSFQPVNKFINL